MSFATRVSRRACEASCEVFRHIDHLQALSYFWSQIFFTPPRDWGCSYSCTLAVKIRSVGSSGQASSCLTLFRHLPAERKKLPLPGLGYVQCVFSGVLFWKRRFSSERDFLQWGQRVDGMVAP